MKSKTIQFFFLVMAGLVIGWREWTNNQSMVSEETIPTNFHQLQETGSATEATTLLWIFILGTIMAFIVNSLLQVPTKLSSPNSV